MQHDTPTAQEKPSAGRSLFSWGGLLGRAQPAVTTSNNTLSEETKRQLLIAHVRAATPWRY